MTTDNDDQDTQGLLLVLLNAVQMLAIAHPNRQAVRRFLAQAEELQLARFELENAPEELKEAYEYYSNKIIAAIPATNAPIDVDMHLDIKL